MKLTKEQVETISKAVLASLKEKELLIFKADEPRVLERITEAILADLRAEDALDREVEEMINSHSAGLGGQTIDHRKMFNMIKSKLVRERGLVI